MSDFEWRPQRKYQHDGIISITKPYYLKPFNADNIRDDAGEFYISMDKLDYEDEVDDGIKCTCKKCGPYIENTYYDQDFNDIDDDIINDEFSDNFDDTPDYTDNMCTSTEVVSTTYEKLTYITKPTEHKSELELPVIKNKELPQTKQMVMGKWANGTKEIRENPFILKLIKKDIVVKNNNISKESFKKDNDIIDDYMYDSDDIDMYAISA